MATGYNGSNVTNKYNRNNYTWIDYTEVTVNSTDTTYTITWQVSFRLMHGSGTTIKLSKGNFSAALIVNGTTVRSFTSTADKQLYGGYDNRWIVITYSQTFNRTHGNQTVTWYSWCKGVSPSSWKGTSTISTQSITLSPRPVGYIEYNPNGGTGSSFQVQKWYDEPLTLVESNFTRANYSKVQWNTATDGSGNNYPLSGTFTENINNTTSAPYYLYMQWHLDYIAPTISAINCVRVDENDAEDDDGTRIKINFNYTCGYLIKDNGGTETHELLAPSINITIMGNDTPDSFDIQGSQSTGTISFSQIFSPTDLTETYSIDKAYSILIEISDTTGGDAMKATGTSTVSTATYPIDLQVINNKVCMGIMSPARSGQPLTFGERGIGPDMSAQQLSDFINSLNPSANPSAANVADYVEEEGSLSERDYYRKWHSGKAEFWYRIHMSSGLTTAAWSSPIYYGDSTAFVSIWQGVFTVAPSQVLVASNFSQIISMIPMSWDANGITNLRYITVGAKSNSAYGFSVYAIGRWK